MLENGSAVAIVLFLALTEQVESDPWSTLLKQVEQLMPPRVWTVVFLGVFTVLCLLTIGDQLSGILGWLGIPSPFKRNQPSTDQLEHTRQQLLKIVKKEIDLRLASSLHNLVKLDLYMEDQRHRVGNPKFELVPEDTEPSFQSVNRVLHPKGNKPPLDLKFTQKIIEVFDRPDIAGKLLVLGELGSGKTTELLQLAQDLVTRVEKDERHPVPVILELSSWNGDSLDKWVAKQLNKLYNLSVDTTQQWLASNQILLLLDGLDELGLTKQRQCIEQINQFLETTRTVEIVVCCRREEYESGQIELDGLNGAVYLEALREDQICQYFDELNRLSLWDNVCSNPTLLELAQKPLFLFMLVVAYQGNPIRNQRELFDFYIKRQLHDPKNQGSYKPGEEPSPEKTLHYLVWLAKQLETISETEFLIEELQPTCLPSPKQAIRLYRLSSEMILILNISLILGLIFGMVIGPTNSEISVLRDLILATIGTMLAICFCQPDSDYSEIPLIELRGKSQWSFRDLFFGVSGGLSLAIVAVPVLVLFNGLISGVRLGLVFGISFGLILGLLVGLRNMPIAEKDIPNQGIRQGLRNALCLGLIFGLIGGLSVGSVLGLFSELRTGLSAGLSAGLGIGLSAALVSGLEAAIKHLILRIFLTINGNTPWNYARFLEHAVKHRFIQRTGGRYRFVHDLLRKHFAAMPLE